MGYFPLVAIAIAGKPYAAKKNEGEPEFPKVDVPNVTPGDFNQEQINNIMNTEEKAG